jgi:hypothetical protein
VITITYLDEVVASLFVSLAVVPTINLLLDICDQGCLLHLLPKIITKKIFTPHPLFSFSPKTIKF